MKIIKSLEDIPYYKLKKIYKKLTQDICLRYDNPEYWADDLIDSILQDLGYELKRA